MLLRNKSNMRHMRRGANSSHTTDILSVHCRGDRRISKDDGFTIIELMIAFTILAIVSGSLFQMFFVSASNNAKAVDVDIANNLAISAVELFKYDPYFIDTVQFATTPGTAAGHTWRSAGGDQYVKYYDEKWNEIEFYMSAAGPGAASPDIAGFMDAAGIMEAAGTMDGAGTIDGAGPDATGFIASAPENASYMLDVALDENQDMEMELNYISAPISLSLDTTQNNRLVINENAGGIEVILNGIAKKIDGSHVGRVISINIEFNAEGVLPKHIAVFNRTGYMANINVFGVPGTSAWATSFASGAGTGSGTGSDVDAELGAGASTEAGAEAGAGSGTGAGDVPQNSYIEVSPVSGSISVLYFDEQAHAADSLMRTIDVTVRELREGGIVLAHIEANKYIPG